jgi:hypothetical protein
MYEKSETTNEGGQCVILFGRIVLDVGFSGRLYFERFYNEY